jgi:hypothetical protein
MECRKSADQRVAVPIKCSLTGSDLSVLLFERQVGYRSDWSPVLEPVSRANVWMSTSVLLAKCSINQSINKSLM